MSEKFIDLDFHLYNTVSIDKITIPSSIFALREDVALQNIFYTTYFEALITAASFIAVFQM